MKTAVLIVDVQNSMFMKGWEVCDHVNILNRIKEIEARAIEKNIPLIYIQHSGDAGSPEEKGTETWKLHTDLKLKGPVVEKTTLNAFESSNLDQLLKQKNITNVIVCGMQSDYCIQANSLGARALGYNVTTIKDAHSTCDSSTQKAADIINDINYKLSQNSIRLLTTNEWMKQS